MPASRNQDHTPGGAGTKGHGMIMCVTVTHEDATTGTSHACDSAAGNPIIFFDEECLFCSRIVRMILWFDKKGKFRFAPIRGETALKALGQIREHPDSAVLVIGGRTYTYSSAVVRILWELGGVVALLGTLLWLVPRPLRDWGYRVVSHYRTRLSGEQKTCCLPRPQERGRFLP